MAYNVSEKYRERVYSGGAVYKCHLTINGTPISPTIISKITINDPIIDTTSEVFYIGSFISKQLTIKFKNVEQLGLQIESGQNVELSIGTMVDNVEEVVPIGKFIIDELGENYYKDCEIICNDYAIKFKPNVDYSPCFVNGKATIDTILEYICTYFEVELDENYPKTNGNVEIGSYDNTLSGKQYISYIAEIKGCNAKIGRDGRLYLIPLKSVPITQINAKKSKSLTIGERFEITSLVFDNGLVKKEQNSSSTYETTLLLTENGDAITTENGDKIIANNKVNTLYIRSENLFILGEYPNGSMEDIINNIFEVVKNFAIYNLTTENYGDVSLDSYDIVSYIIDNNTYNTFYNSTITYEMNVMSKIEVNIPTKQQETSTNIVGQDEKSKIRRLETTYDTINNELVLKATDDGKLTIVKLGANAESGSEFNVKADNITLEGYTTINNGFNIDEEGNANINGGKLNLISTKDINSNINIFSIDPQLYMRQYGTGFDIEDEEMNQYGYFQITNESAEMLLAPINRYYNENYIFATVGAIKNLIRVSANSNLYCEYTETGERLSSDKRCKENIDTIDKVLSLKIIKELNPVEYNYIGSKHKHRGLIAQEVKEVLNDNNIKDEIYNYDETKDRYSLNYIEFIPDLINCVKYQQEQIEELKRELERIKNGE